MFSLAYLCIAVYGRDMTDSPMKRARLEQGLSQEQLAAKLADAGTPVNHGTLSRIERGEVSPRPSTRRAIATALGLELADLP